MSWVGYAVDMVQVGVGRIFAAAGVLPLLGTVVWAGAFMQPSGRGQVIITARFEASDTYLDSRGRRQPVRDYRKFELQAWTEYGLTGNVTLIAAPSAMRIATSVQANPVRRAAEVRDTYGKVEAGARFRVWSLVGGIMSLQATAALSAKVEQANQAGIRYDRNEIDLRVLYGRNFNWRSWRGFVDIQTAYRMRAGALDEWCSDITLGVQASQRWMLLVQNFNVVALPGRTMARRRSHKLQMSLVYRFAQNWSAQAGMFTTFAARRARRDKGYIAALWRTF